MLPITLAAALLFVAPQQPEPAPQPPPPQAYKFTPEQLEQIRQKGEIIRQASRQAANRLNQLAGGIHSESDARAFIDAVAEQLTGHKHQSWTTRSIRRRVAHTEYLAVSDPSRLVPEQRIVNVWNEFVRELDAPAETLITVPELHNLRDATLTASQRMWTSERFGHSPWMIPGLYATNGDGKVADGCRAVEALKLLHDMFYSFQSVESSRERVQKGVLVSDSMPKQDHDGTSRPSITRSHLSIGGDPNPLPAAEYHYVQNHGEHDYSRLMERLFAEMFPAE